MTTPEMREIDAKADEIEKLRIEASITSNKFKALMYRVEIARLEELLMD